MDTYASTLVFSTHLILVLRCTLTSSGFNPSTYFSFKGNAQVTTSVGIVP